PPGMLGGRDGAPNEVTVTRQGGDYVSPHLSKDEDIRVVAGDAITVRTPGGGGYGDPWQRDPALVARDVARGYITADAASGGYTPAHAAPGGWGVVPPPADPPLVDRRATDERRRRTSGRSQPPC